MRLDLAAWRLILRELPVGSHAAPELRSPKPDANPDAEGVKMAPQGHAWQNLNQQCPFGVQRSAATASRSAARSSISCWAVDDSELSVASLASSSASGRGSSGSKRQ